MKFPQVQIKLSYKICEFNNNKDVAQVHLDQKRRFQSLQQKLSVWIFKRCWEKMMKFGSGLMQIEHIPVMRHIVQSDFYVIYLIYHVIPQSKRRFTRNENPFDDLVTYLILSTVNSVAFCSAKKPAAELTLVATQLTVGWNCHLHMFLDKNAQI